jgi:hypothetical protein
VKKSKEKIFGKPIRAFGLEKSAMRCYKTAVYASLPVRAGTENDDPSGKVIMRTKTWQTGFRNRE